jgi:hypothetical protein
VIQAQEKEEEVQPGGALLSRGKRAVVWFALRRDFVLTLQINYAGGGVVRRAREREKISSLHDLAATVTARTHFSPRKPGPFFRRVS